MILWRLAISLMIILFVGGCFHIDIPAVEEDSSDTTLSGEWDTTTGGNGTDKEWDTTPQDTGTSFVPPRIDFVPTYGHFTQDPQGSIGYLVDSVNEVAMVLAFGFDYPFYRGSFTPRADVEPAVNQYYEGEPYSKTAPGSSKYPALSHVATDSRAIEHLENDFIAFLLQENLDSSEPLILSVAYSGGVTLTREDGPYDWVDGTLYFQEIYQISDPGPLAGSVRLVQFCAQEDVDQLDSFVIKPCDSMIED